MRLLPLAHCIPSLLPRRVPHYVVDLHRHDEDNVPGQDAEDDEVATTVERSVVGAVDLGVVEGQGDLVGVQAG